MSGIPLLPERSPCLCEPVTVLEPISRNVRCMCIEAPLSLVVHWVDEWMEEHVEENCAKCHGKAAKDLWETAQVVIEESKAGPKDLWETTGTSNDE